MGWLVPVCIVLGIAVLTFIGNRLGVIRLTEPEQKRRGGIGGGLTGIGDEVFAPTRHEAAMELDRQTVLPAPAPVAGDGDYGVYGGKVSIHLQPATGPIATRPRRRDIR